MAAHFHLFFCLKTLNYCVFRLVWVKQNSSHLVNKFPWAALLKEDTSKAYCTICKKAFRNDGSGKSQVSSHSKSHSIKDGGQNTKKNAAIDPIQ